MEKLESNKNYESELIDSVKKDSRKKLDDLESEVTSEYANFDTPEDAVSSILDEMKTNKVSYLRKITLNGVSSRKNNVTYHTRGTGYEFVVSYQVDDGIGKGNRFRDNTVNYTISYDGRSNKFYDGSKEIGEDQALEELVKIYSLVCAINDSNANKRIGGNNGGNNNSSARR